MTSNVSTQLISGFSQQDWHFPQTSELSRETAVVKPSDELRAEMAIRKLPRERSVPVSASWLKVLPGDQQSASRGDTGQSAISLEPLQEWEGFVIAVTDTTFTARLFDKTKGDSAEDEVADFPLDDLREDDFSLLKEGAVFRWVIGYQRQVSGTKVRASQIIFRRMPAWTRPELRRAYNDADKLIAAIDWE